MHRWIFVSRQWSLDYRCQYISSRGWYMFGFGEWTTRACGSCCEIVRDIRAIFVFIPLAGTEQLPVAGIRNILLTPGLPATLLTSFGPPLINMAIFSLIYPFVSFSPVLGAHPSF